MDSSTLSAGAALRLWLLSDADIAAAVTDIFPVVAHDEALLPYISYRRTGLSPRAATGGNVDHLRYDLYVFSDDYQTGLDLAAAIRRRVEGKRLDASDEFGIIISRVTILDGASEGWAGDSFYQYIPVEISATVVKL